MASLVMAVDGGGTKSVLGLADRTGAAVAVASRSGCNPMDNPCWREELVALLEGARVPWPSVERALLGMPGYGEAPDIDAKEEAAIRELVPVPHRILNDVQMAHDAAFLGQPGILILAGTGSMAWATDETGASVRVGGWGHDIGDEGSGYWIGREAVTRLSWALDGRLDAQRFAGSMAQRLALDSGGDLSSGLMEWLCGLPRKRSGIAAIAAEVDALAGEGNRSALEILERAAEHLHQHISTARRRIGGKCLLPWSQLGGVFASKVIGDLLASHEGTKPLAAPLPPVGGGLWRAAQEAGWDPDHHWIERLAASLMARLPTLGRAPATHIGR
jgi:glucosamine kinase